MTIAGEPLNCKLAIKALSIDDQVISFKYLECTITSTGFLKEELRRHQESSWKIQHVGKARSESAKHIYNQ